MLIIHCFQQFYAIKTRLKIYPEDILPGLVVKKNCWSNFFHNWIVFLTNVSVLFFFLITQENYCCEDAIIFMARKYFFYTCAKFNSIHSFCQKKEEMFARFFVIKSCLSSLSSQNYLAWHSPIFFLPCILVEKIRNV